jgi:RNA polymerase sigma-70 factor (ECF subfamily)
MGDRQDAEDLAQEVFLKVYQARDSLQDPNTLTAWIIRITRNTCYDAITYRSRRASTVSLTSHNSDRDEELRYTDARQPTPEEAALRAENQRALAATLARLDRRARQALALRDIEGHTYQEIGEMLALGPSAVKMRIRRARLAFRAELATVDPELRG